MKKIIALAFVFAALIFIVESCGGNDKTTLLISDSLAGPPPPPPPMPPPPPVEGAGIKEGKVVYEAKCVLCHGADGSAGVMGAKDLASSRIQPSELMDIINNGRNGMKSFSGELSSIEIMAVGRYVQSLRK